MLVSPAENSKMSVKLLGGGGGGEQGTQIEIQQISWSSILRLNGSYSEGPGFEYWPRDRLYFRGLMLSYSLCKEDAVTVH
jgi:hypothetical protein